MRKGSAAAGLVAVLLSWVTAPVFAQERIELRGDVERDLGSIEAAFQLAPDNEDIRRSYGDVLFRLGNIWQANDVIEPLGVSSSSSVNDLQLGARIALML